MSTRKSSELLEESLKHLGTGKDDYKIPYVCITLNQISTSSSKEQQKILNIKYHIAKLLGSRLTIHDWLHFIAKIPAEQLTPKNLYEYRVRWVHHLIEYYKSLGD